MDNLFSLKSISMYRTELMGFAIIGVLVGHIINFGDLNYTLIDSIAHGIHTPGFLFLSGFGLYYSFKKNHNVKQFYIRRFWRFYLPYVLIYLPFLCRTIFTGKFNFLSFFEKITTLNFWLHGNNDGMWYIAVQLVLYLITPLFFLALERREKYAAIIIGGGILCVILTNTIIQYVNGNYWDMVSIGLKHTHMFFWGMLIAILSLRYKDNSLPIIASSIVITVLYFVFRFNGVEIPYLTPLLILLFYTVLLCTMFSALESFNVSFVGSIFRWFGKYTLELYLLHLFINGFLYSPFFHFNDLFRIIIAVVVSIVICAPVQYLINKLKTIILKITW